MSVLIKSLRGTVVHLLSPSDMTIETLLKIARLRKRVHTSIVIMLSNP